MKQPKEKLVVLTGNKFELSCRAESAPGKDVKYKWFKCNKDGKNKQLVQQNCMNLVILEATVSHKGFYVCEISDQVPSRVICVEVVNPANITITMQPPKEKYTELGEELTLECKAKCSQYPVNYQWYFNGQPLPNCNERQLVITSVADTDIGSYYCTASSEYSANVATSEMSKLLFSKLYCCCI